MIRTVFAAIMLLHGLIHFMGFAQAWGIGKTTYISMEISRPMGLLWLLCLLLFALAAQLQYMKRDWWHIGIVAVLLSQVLIMGVWNEARYGTIINVFIVVPAMLNIASWQFRYIARREAWHMLNAVAASSKGQHMNNIEQLPVPVRTWLLKSGADRHTGIRTVRLKQKGMLRMEQQAKWMDMTAEQYFTTDGPAFSWFTHIKYGVTHVAGNDEFRDGKGRMLIKVASLIPVADAKGVEADQGTMLRYLAEIQWFPTAALSPNITWQPQGNLAAEATMTYKGIKVTGTFHFNADGDVAAFEAMRYMERKGKYSLERWYVPVTAYRTFDGIRVPSEGKAIWKLKTGDFDWFHWEITDINYNLPRLY